MPGHKAFTSTTLASADVNDYLMKQSIMKFADTSARDTALSGILRDGMMAYTTDTGTLWVYTSTGIASAQWVRESTPWMSWPETPAFTSGVTEGDGTFDVVRRYIRGSMQVRGQFQLGSTSAITGVPRFDVSWFLTSTASHFSGGMAAARDASATRWYNGSSLVGIGGDEIVIQTDGGLIDSSTPFTWTTSDLIVWDILITHPDLDVQ